MSCQDNLNDCSSSQGEPKTGQNNSDPNSSEPSDKLGAKFENLNLLEGASAGKKIKLPVYNDCDAPGIWLDKVVMIMDLAGIARGKRRLGYIVSELPENIQDACLLKMSENNISTTEQLPEILREVAKVSNTELETNLKNMRFDQAKHKTFRNFFYRIKSIISSQLPAGTPSKTIASVALREFRTKVPKVVQTEPFFMCDESENPEQVIMKAQAIYDKSRSSSSYEEQANYFPEPRRFRSANRDDRFYSARGRTGSYANNRSSFRGNYSDSQQNNRNPNRSNYNRRSYNGGNRNNNVNSQQNGQRRNNRTGHRGNSHGRSGSSHRQHRVRFNQ